jgi:hypothetical protein
MLDSACMGRDILCTDKEHANNAKSKRNIVLGKVHLIVGSI